MFTSEVAVEDHEVCMHLIVGGAEWEKNDEVDIVMMWECEDVKTIRDGIHFCY